MRIPDMMEDGEWTPPPDIRLYHGEVYIEDGHHRLEAQSS